MAHGRGVVARPGCQTGQRGGTLEVFKDKELCCKAPEPPPCEPDLTSDEFFRPSAATGTWTFMSVADGPDLARPGSPGAAIPGRSGSMAGKEAHAEEASELPKGLCPDEADRPEGPSRAPIGTRSPVPGTEMPVFAAPAAPIAEFAAPSPPTAAIPTAIPPIAIPPIPAAAAGAVNAHITLAVTNIPNTLARPHIAMTSLISAGHHAVISQGRLPRGG
jgi:hypothetical protein